MSSGPDPRIPISGTAGRAGRADVPIRGSARRGRFADGEVIAERYRVVRFIASGGMGEVYEVEDEVLGERLALKTLRAELIADEVQRGRFKREIQLASRVTHRSVCRIFTAGLHDRDDGPPQPFLTMELLDGESLRQRVARRGRLTPEEALPLVRQMADAIDAAHHVGVVHRDLKSGNVMLVEDRPFGERAVITDFGLARAVATDDERSLYETQPSEGLIGTAAYISPEQATGSEITPASDIYALGVLLFFMVTGTVPFAEKGILQAAIARLRRKPPSPRQHVPDLDRRWEAAILRCLEREPKDRFADAGELVEALEGKRSALAPARFRRRVLYALAGIAAAAGLAVAILTWPARKPGTTVRAGDPVQLTIDEGLEIDPSFSPDGGRLVFSSDRDGGFELYTASLAAGGSQLLLTTDGQRNVQPAWSPAGEQIAYVSQARGGIWTIPEAGGKPSRLSAFGSRPAWSPDGRAVVFQEDGRHEVAERTVPALPPSTLWVVELGAAGPSEPRRLTEVGTPAGGHGEPNWSPDGERIAFSVGDRRRTAIWSIGVDGTDPRPMATESRVNVDPQYSSDGRFLYWVGVAQEHELRAAAYAVWRVAVDGGGEPLGKAQPVTRLGVATIRQIALSPDGRQLVYGALNTYSHLWSLPLAGGGPAAEARALTRGRNRNSRPAFSRDGRWLAFDRWQVGTNLDIWVLDMDREGSAPRQVTLAPEWDSQATWFPAADGLRLAYFSERDGRRALSTADLEGGGKSVLADIGSEADWARLSPDGKRIAFHSRAGGAILDTFVYDIAAGESRRLTSDPEMAAFPVWSPDGSWLAVEVRRDGGTQVAVIPAAGGEPEVLTAEPGESWPFSWAPDNDRIAFAALRDGFWNLWWVSRTTREQRRLTEYRRLNAYVRYPAWSPRDDRLVFERSETVGDLWRVELSSQSP